MSLSQTEQVCGARTRDGGTCQEAPINGTGRCRLHGGASTGPKTAEGRKRTSEANKQRWRKIAVALMLLEQRKGASG
ncbi:HGGxSTG domain-containing protein [Ruegeria jejuensis]|uniref:HGGxSTG domain-containing protein n=1 Tax=Ruegeria jejuensis TaxID=3233338 RepID=UPI00355B7A40